MGTETSAAMLQMMLGNSALLPMSLRCTQSSLGRNQSNCKIGWRLPWDSPSNGFSYLHRSYYSFSLKAGRDEGGEPAHPSIELQ